MRVFVAVAGRTIAPQIFREAPKFGQTELVSVRREGEAGRHGTNQMGLKSDTAWKTAARLAALAEETVDNEEREYLLRMRDAWITLANRCEPFDFPDVTEK